MVSQMHHGGLCVSSDVVMIFFVPEDIASGHLHSTVSTVVTFASNQMMSSYTSMLLVSEAM